MKSNDLISCYVKILPSGMPVVYELGDDALYLYHEIRITKRVKDLVEKLKEGHRIVKRSLSWDEMHQIGLCYWYGYVVPQNYRKAVSLYKSSSKGKINSAEWCLYVCYRDGAGVSQNYAVAKEWLKKSARHGNSRAQLTIAKYYYDGELFNCNRRSAKMWFERASINAFAEKDAEVLFCLGIMYYQGTYGMRIDVKKSIRHLELAAELKDALSILLLIEVYHGLSDYEKVNHWKGELKKCPYPVPNILRKR